MHWTADTYVATAGDVGAPNFGRAWNARKKTWQTVGLLAFPPDILPDRPLTLRGIDLRVYTPGGAILTGIRAMVFIYTDPTNPDQVMVVKDGFQSLTKIWSWTGSMPLCGGLQWRIHRGALLVNSIIGIGVAYE
jgi:hypothetical protein